MFSSGGLSFNRFLYISALMPIGARELRDQSQPRVMRDSRAGLAQGMSAT